MNDPEAQNAISRACQLWRYFNERNWEAAKSLLSDDFEAIWPQSREKIVGADNFLALNREYPGNGDIHLGNCRYGYDRFENIHEVTTTVRINWKKPNGTNEDLFAISFFEIDCDGLIRSTVEYWAETYPAPEWRKRWVEKY